jgi:hypothetical protein
MSEIDNEGETTNPRKCILDVVSDLVLDFVAYDRKEDDELPRGAIDNAVNDGIISIEEIVSQFEKELRSGLDLTET